MLQEPAAIRPALKPDGEDSRRRTPGRTYSLSRRLLDLVSRSAIVLAPRRADLPAPMVEALSPRTCWGRKGRRALTRLAIASAAFVKGHASPRRIMSAFPSDNILVTALTQILFHPIEATLRWPICSPRGSLQLDTAIKRDFKNAIGLRPLQVWVEAARSEAVPGTPEVRPRPV
jgi:hypothetical protein